MNYKIGYIEGQVGILKALRDDLDSRIDLLIDQQSLLRKGKSTAAVREWEGRISELDIMRDVISNNLSRLSKLATWTHRLPINRSTK